MTWLNWETLYSAKKKKKMGNFICNCILLKMEENALNLVRDIYGMRVTWCFKKKKKSTQHKNNLKCFFFSFFGKCECGVLNFIILYCTNCR